MRIPVFSERIFSRLNMNFGIKLLMLQRREAIMIIWMGRGEVLKPQIPMNGSEFFFLRIAVS